MPETHSSTRREKAARNNLWRNITQATEACRHKRSGPLPIHEQKIGISRKTHEGHLRSVWSQREGGNAPCSEIGRPEQARAKGETTLDENHDGCGSFGTRES